MTRGRRSSLPLRNVGAIVLALAVLRAEVLAEECIGDCNQDGRVTIEEVVGGVNIGLGNLPTSFCPAADEDASGRVTIEEIVSAVRNGLEGCPALPDREAFVVGTDFQSGGFVALPLDAPEDASDLRSTIHSDAVPRVLGTRLFVVNRFLGDNIQRLDPDADFDTTWQCSTGNGSNPQDIAVLDDEKAYVSRLSERSLLVVDPSPATDCSDFTLGEIDLAALADADGIPEMDQMAIVDGLLYVSLQRLENFAPAGPGKIAVVDTATDRVVGDITLSGENPFATTKGLVVRDGHLLVAETGDFGVLDGGIERVDLADRTAEGFFITEQELGGDINDFVVVTDRIGYAVVARSDFTTSLVRFDPSAGTATGAVLEGVEFISDIEANDRGELYVLDRTFERPGVRIFRVEDGRELTMTPVEIGLPPFQVVFLP